MEAPVKKKRGNRRIRKVGSDSSSETAAMDANIAKLLNSTPVEMEPPVVEVKKRAASREAAVVVNKAASIAIGKEVATAVEVKDEVKEEPAATSAVVDDLNNDSSFSLKPVSSGARRNGSRGAKITSSLVCKSVVKPKYVTFTEMSKRVTGAAAVDPYDMSFEDDENDTSLSPFQIGRKRESRPLTSDNEDEDEKEVKVKPAPKSTTKTPRKTVKSSSKTSSSIKRNTTLRARTLRKNANSSPPLKEETEKEETGKEVEKEIVPKKRTVKSKDKKKSEDKTKKEGDKDEDEDSRPVRVTRSRGAKDVETFRGDNIMPGKSSHVKVIKSPCSMYVFNIHLTQYVFCNDKH